MNIYNGQLTALLGHNGAGKKSTDFIFYHFETIVFRKEYYYFDDYWSNTTYKWSNYCAWF
jgi:hypothetical protein